jgi:hypothetical protein
MTDGDDIRVTVLDANGRQLGPSSWVSGPLRDAGPSARS